jgi:hypothetical protein
MLEYVRKYYFYQELRRCVTDCERMKTIVQVLLVIRHRSLDRTSVPESVPKRFSLPSLRIILDCLNMSGAPVRYGRRQFGKFNLRNKIV